MADNIAPVHHQTTTDSTAAGQHGYSTAEPTFRQQNDTIVQQHATGTETSAPTDYSRERLSSVHEARTSLGSDPSAPLASTEGPFKQPTTDDVSSKKEAALTSSVGSQNAPGRPGAIGEGVLSAFGYGGSQVERPKEEQGIGEKIVNFLGA